MDQTKQNLNEIQKIIKQIKAQNDEDQEGMRAQYKKLMEENNYIRSNYEKLKKTYQKELTKRKKTEGNEAQAIASLEQQIKVLKFDNESKSEKIRLLTEDLRFFQKIYGSKVKRR